MCILHYNGFPVIDRNEHVLLWILKRLRNPCSMQGRKQTPWKHEDVHQKSMLHVNSMQLEVKFNLANAPFSSHQANIMSDTLPLPAQSTNACQK